MPLRLPATSGTSPPFSTSKLQPLLRNNAVPLHVRATVFRGTVLQSCLYGAEVWGGSLQRVRLAQRVVSSGLRLLVGCGLDSKLPAMFAGSFRALR
jgi:hypothetical protein